MNGEHLLRCVVFYPMATLFFRTQQSPGTLDFLTPAR